MPLGDSEQFGGRHEGKADGVVFVVLGAVLVFSRRFPLAMDGALYIHLERSSVCITILPKASYGVRSSAVRLV